MAKITALLCVFGLGVCPSLLGSIKVKPIPRLKIDPKRFGALVSATMFSSPAASLIAGVVCSQNWIRSAERRYETVNSRQVRFRRDGAGRRRVRIPLTPTETTRTGFGHSVLEVTSGSPPSASTAAW